MMVIIIIDWSKRMKSAIKLFSKARYYAPGCDLARQGSKNQFIRGGRHEYY